MSTDVLDQVQYGHCRPIQRVKENPQHFQHSPYLRDTTHCVFMVQDSPTSGPIHVNIFNGSNGTSVPLMMNSADTIGELKQKFLETTKPDFKGNLDLVYNGKPAEAHQTLADLQVKHGATFLILHRCHGG